MQEVGLGALRRGIMGCGGSKDAKAPEILEEETAEEAKWPFPALITLSL